MKTFTCTISSPHEQLFSGTLQMLVASSVSGDLGILPGHAPLLAMLSPGPVNLTMEDGSKDIFYVSGGFLEVQPEQVIVLADASMRAEQLSSEKIEQERQKALTIIQGKDTSMDYAEALQHLARAAAQLRVLRELRKISK